MAFGWLLSASQVASPRKTMLPAQAVGFEGVARSGRGICSPPGQSLLAWAENLGYFSAMSPGSKQSSTRNTTGQWSAVATAAGLNCKKKEWREDPYTYACGSPTIKNRQKWMPGFQCEFS